MKNFVVMAAVALMSLVVLESTASAQIFGRRTVCRTRTVSCVKERSCEQACARKSCDACVSSSCGSACGANLLHVPGRVVHAVGNAVHNVLTPDCSTGQCTVRRVERTVVREKIVAPATSAPAPVAPAAPTKAESLQSLPPQTAPTNSILHVEREITNSLGYAPVRGN